MASLILHLSSNNGPMIAFTSDLGSKPTGSLDTAVEGLCPHHPTSHLSTLARTRINKAKTREKKESVTILGNPRDKDRTNPWSHLQKIKNQFKYCHVKIVMSSLPQARPQSKAGAALGPCLGHGPLWGLGYHFLAPSGSMEQQTGFAVSSNSFRLLVASFATLFLALSFSSFKNSRRVNFHRAFWETGKHNQVNAFYVPPRCRHLAPSLPAPSNTRNTGPSRARWMQPAAAIHSWVLAQSSRSRANSEHSKAVVLEAELPGPRQLWGAHFTATPDLTVLLTPSLNISGFIFSVPVYFEYK